MAAQPLDSRTALQRLLINALGLALVWAAGAVLWSLAAAGGGTVSVRAALPVGAAQMGAATLAGIGVWSLTGRVRFKPAQPRFIIVHVAALSAYAALYTVAPIFALVKGTSIPGAIRHAVTSPTFGWNLLIGSFIYCAIAGLSYSRRSEVALMASERASAAARVAAREAQLAALAAQLQPHFLFNALHTVGALLHTDTERADRALDELGRLLRYALREPGGDVTLREEWQFARDYLAFEGLRLGARLRLGVAVADEALPVPVPPLLLQPLLENAVRHGVSEYAEGGSIAVAITRSNGAVRVEVRNSVPPDRMPGAGMAGSGLRRLSERLALRYGDRASLTAAPEPEGFRVTLTLPAGEES